MVFRFEWEAFSQKCRHHLNMVCLSYMWLCKVIHSHTHTFPFANRSHSWLSKYETKISTNIPCILKLISYRKKSIIIPISLAHIFFLFTSLSLLCPGREYLLLLLAFISHAWINLRHISIYCAIPNEQKYSNIWKIPWIESSVYLKIQKCHYSAISLWKKKKFSTLLYCRCCRHR